MLYAKTMASIIPTFSPEDFPQEKLVEKTAYEFFLRCAPSHWDVLWGVDVLQLGRNKNDGGRKKLMEFEMDFIVFIPNTGIVIVEVKHYHGTLHNTKSKEPWNQAHREWQNLASVLNILKPDLFRLKNGFLNSMPRLPITYAAMFTGDVEYENPLNRNTISTRFVHTCLANSEYSGNNNSEKVSQCFTNLFKKDLQKILLSNYEDSEFSMADDMKSVHQLLSDVIQHDRTSINRQQMERMALNELIACSLEILNSNNHCHVYGCAGSGKTFLATRKIHHELKKGRRVLYLSFNKGIAQWLAHLIQNTLQNKITQDSSSNEFHFDNGSSLKVVNFHRFLEECLADSSFIQESITGKTPAETTIFWEETLPALVQNRQLLPTGSYDTILIDEAQDFRSEWLDIAASLGKAKGHLHLFADKNQNIYGKLSTHMPHFCNIPLRRNFRNSRNIAEFSVRLAPDLHISPRSNAHHGPVPSISLPPQNTALETCLNTSLAHLYKNKGSVVILAASRAFITALTQAAEQHGHYVFTTDIREWLAEPKLLLATTVSAFKGLEADCIILADAKVPTSFSDKVKEPTLLAYVAATRAKHELHILCHDEAAQLHYQELSPTPSEA